MKTIVVGDTHLKQPWIMSRVDAACEACGANRIVFLGDYCDEWGARDDTAVAALHEFARWVDMWRADGVRVDVLVGNHDFCYLMEVDGPGTQRRIMGTVQDILGGLDMRAATEAGGFLLTHAGVTSTWAYANFSDVQWGGGNETPTQAARLINAMFDDRDCWRDLNSCGAGRGGSNIPGPLWADKHELARDPLAGIDQIVGHTPVRACERLAAHTGGAGGPSSGAPEIWACDTFSLTSVLLPIGDGGMLAVDDEAGVEVLDFAACGSGDWASVADMFYKAR